MTALYIILGILAFLFLITLIKVELFFTYTEEPFLTLKILFIKIQLVPPQKKSKKKKKPEKKKEPSKQKIKEEKTKKKEKKPSYLSKLKEKKGLSGLISLFLSVAELAATTLKNIFSHIVVHKFDVYIQFVGSDAADTAVKYGELCGAIYSSVNIINGITDFKDYNVKIEPLFDENKKTCVKCDIHAHIRIIFIVFHAVLAGIRLLWLRIKS